MSRPTLLWIGKQPTASGGGDEIYDKKIINNLQFNFDIQQMYVQKKGFFSSIISLLKGIPHPRFKYISNKSIEDIKDVVNNYDHVVISWESFDFLARHLDRPLTLIVHNVMSDTIRQIFGGNPLSVLASKNSKMWEDSIYGKENVNVVVLSKRDCELISGATSSESIFIASPGCPPSEVLNKECIINEVVISGSYEWYPKRRDLGSIVKNYEESQLSFKFRHDRPFPSVFNKYRMSRESSEIREADYKEGLRIGLLPDTFLGGFKLKSTFYVAKNCILASMADIYPEFSDLPHAREFVKVIKSLEEIDCIISELYEKEDEDLFSRWNEFKVACLDKFSWDGAARNIIQSL